MTSGPVASNYEEEHSNSTVNTIVVEIEIVHKEPTTVLSVSLVHWPHAHQNSNAFRQRCFVLEGSEYL